MATSVWAVAGDESAEEAEVEQSHEATCERVTREGLASCRAGVRLAFGDVSARGPLAFGNVSVPDAVDSREQYHLRHPQLPCDHWVRPNELGGHRHACCGRTVSRLGEKAVERAVAYLEDARGELSRTRGEEVAAAAGTERGTGV